jgi:hypothetical protein
VALHSSTFEFLTPTDEQLKAMSEVRLAARGYAMIIEAHVPEGPDKTYILRKLREIAMWVNMSIMRLPDGTPRLSDEALRK